jgi:penicillin-binding protein 1A
MTRAQRQRLRRARGGKGHNKALLALMVVLILIGLAGLSAVGYVVSIASSAPPLSSLKPRDLGSATQVFAADGETRLGFIQNDELRQIIPGDEIPQVIKDATVSIEDERFYTHDGVDYEGVIRAAVENLASRKTVQGGSTITMQLVRSLYISNERTFERKVREAKLAEELENERSKEWILEQYLNAVPYGTLGGQTALGIQAASRMYFGKAAKDLELHEAALLAGLPQAPSLYSPARSPEAAISRRNQVLSKMAEQGYITEAESAKAQQRKLGLDISRYFQARRESYFFDYVKDELVKAYNPTLVRQGGLKVYTTIDLDKQQEARAAINRSLAGVGPSSAIVTIDPDNGYIRAMASSADYGKSKFNLAAQGHRQPGSVFKIMTLMTALRRGVDPQSTSYSGASPKQFTNTPYGSFEVKNYGGASMGTMNLVQATLNSVNTIYIQLAMDLGPEEVAKTARDMGITTKLDGYPAESLGGLKIGVSPLEVANAFATIASGGYRNRPVAITKVVHPDGEVQRRDKLPRRLRAKRVKVFKDGVTYEAIKILEQNIQGGTGTRANIGCPAGGKTGTTDNNNDAWFAGFTPRLATAVWVGFPDAQIQMTGLYHGANVDGGTFPAEIWGNYMRVAKGGYCGDFPQPKEPASFSPFFGSSASTGSTDSSDQYGTSPPTTPVPAPAVPEPDTGGDEEGFDPDLYESPPQGPPGGGNGNGNGNGNGGASPNG